MSFVLKSRIKEVTTTTGTGTYTLSGAVTGFLAFSQIGNGNTTWYCVSDNTNFEIGLGTYTTSGTTLSRDIIYSSSNSGNAVNWGAGNKNVVCTDIPEAQVNTYSDTTLASNASVTITHISDSGYKRVPYATIDGAAGDNTVLLLQGDGSDGSTTFTDSSFYNRTVTANGNVQIDTAQSKFGGASILYDGSGDFLNLTGTISDFVFGTGDFTIAMWVRQNVQTGDQGLIDFRPSEGAYPCLYLGGGTIKYYVSSADRITGSALSANTWYHVAVCRSGTSTKLFVDGTQVGSTYSDSTNYLQGSSRPVLGIFGTTLSTGSYSGWQDSVLVMKGTALYTSNFTAPASAYTVASPIKTPLNMSCSIPSTQDSDRLWVRYDDGAGSDIATKTTFTNKTGQSITGRFGVKINRF